MVGDFNLILDFTKTLGGQQHDMIKSLFFQNFVNDNQLVDLGFEGYPYIWNNQLEGNENVQERLDRFLVSQQ